MFVYRDRQFRIGRKHPLYGCCDTVTALCCNLENAVRFRQRQLLAVVKRGDIPKKLIKTGSNKVGMDPCVSTMAGVSRRGRMSKVKRY